MELPSSDKYYKLSVEEMDTPKLLANAARQRDVRKYDTFPIIDCDFHHYESESLTEIIDLFADPVLRQLAQSAQQKSSGAGSMFGVGRIGYQDRGGRITRYPLRKTEKTPADGTHRHVHVVQRWMDAMGVDYTCLFPGPLLGLGLHPQSEVEVAMARAYNRWLTEKVLLDTPRVGAMLCLPFGDHRATYDMIKEFGGCKGVAGFCIAAVRDNAVHSDDYMKSYALLEEMGISLAFHSGTNWGSAQLRQANRFITVHALSFPWYNVFHCTNWIINALPERFPKLKVIWIEGGLAWVPWLMQRLDHEYKMRTSEAPGLKKLPSEYLTDMYFSSQPMENTHPEALELTFKMMKAETQMLYASDYPHWDMDLPSTVYDLPFLDEKAKRNILGENARKLFKIDYGELSGLSAATVIG